MNNRIHLRRIELLLALVLILPGVAAAQLVIQPSQPRVLETVHVAAPASALSEYNPFTTLVTMSGSSITVSLQLIPPSSSLGAPVIPLDVVLGQFPSGNYDVSVVTRDANGAPVGTVGTAHLTVTARDPSQFAPLYDYSDLWWNPSESGWGMSIVQHPSQNLFAAWFVYGSDGKPVWFVLPAGRWTSSTFSGTAYKTTGPFYGGAFNPSAVVVSQAGTAALTFNDYSHGVFVYTVDGVTVQKNIQRQPF